MTRGVTRTRALAVLPPLGFVAVLLLVQLDWRPLRRLDLDVATGLNDATAPHPAAVSFWKVVSTFGQPLTFQVLAVLTAFWLARRRQGGLAIWTVATVVLAGGLSNLVKWLVDRARPTVPDALSQAAGSSFPSGHALSSLVGVTVLLLVWTATTARTRRAAIGPGVVVVALVGFSRLALGVHYLSDVLAGWLLGATWVLVTRWALHRLERRAWSTARPARRRASPDRPPPARS